MFSKSEFMVICPQATGERQDLAGHRGNLTKFKGHTNAAVHRPPCSGHAQCKEKLRITGKPQTLQLLANAKHSYITLGSQGNQRGNCWKTRKRKSLGLGHTEGSPRLGKAPPERPLPDTGRLAVAPALVLGSRN